MKIIDDSTKKLHWWNRNYFFVGTILIVTINIMIFAFAGNTWVDNIGEAVDRHWGDIFWFDNLVRAFLDSFIHANWQHVLLNMLCFFIAGIYLERKKGTLNLLLLVLIMAFFTGIACQANSLGFSRGYSGVNYGIYAYIIVDYLFMFRKDTRTKFNIISGAVVLGLIYFAMCFNGGVETTSFAWYPYDFMTNMGHYSSFLVGIILGLTINLVKLMSLQEHK